jgi:type VI secretion system protein ImpJ
MQLKRSADVDAAPEINTDYIPPLLGCDAWAYLKEEILASIVAQLGSFSRSQADYIQTHGGWTEANQPQVRKALLQLHAVNGCFPYLRQLTDARGTHPFLAYTELCRLVGQLSIFRSNWQPPDLPLYDHDDLGRIFRAVKSEIELCLTSEGPTAKVQRFPFLGVEEWMEVGLDPKWLRNKNLGFYVGVRSDLTAERLELLFSDRWLDWKLGSSRTVTQIFKNGEAGLSIRRVVGVHQALPALQGVTYFEVDPRGRYWDQVAESRTLALKVNQQYIRNEFVGTNVLTVVDPKNNPRDLKLELFVVDNE